MATIIEKKGRYYIQYWISSKRKTIKTQLEVSDENYKKVIQMRNKIQEKVEIRKRDMKYRDILNVVESKTNNKEITIERALQSFKLKLSMTSASHQYTFDVAMNHFLNIVPLSYKVNKVTYEHSLLYIKYLTEKNLSKATIRTYFDNVKMLFNFLLKHKYIHESPMDAKVLPRKSKKTIVVFGKEMLDDIISGAKIKDNEFYCILMFLLLTGIRPIDLLKIKVGDINFGEKKIYIKIAKTDKEMNIPMSKALYDFIMMEMKHIYDLEYDQFIFPGYTVSRLGRKFRRLKKKLRITEKFTYTLKTFRKTFATHYAKGLDIQDVAYLLGHDKIATTREYYADTIVENVRSKMDNFDNKNRHK